MCQETGWVIIGWGNGLVPVQHQSITLTNTEINLNKFDSIWYVETDYNVIWVKVQSYSLKKCIWKCYVQNDCKLTPRYSNIWSDAHLQGQFMVHWLVSYYDLDESKDHGVCPGRKWV